MSSKMDVLVRRMTLDLKLHAFFKQEQSVTYGLIFKMCEIFGKLGIL